MTADGSRVRGTGEIVLDIDAVPVVSFPMTNSRLPVVRRIALRLAAAPGDATTLAGVVVQVELRDIEGRVGSLWERVVDLVPDATTLLEDIDLDLDPATMLQITERRPGNLTVQVHGDGRLLAERSLGVELLAARQWQTEPAVLALELLPAYITPQDPAVAELVRVALTLVAEGGTGASMPPPAATAPADAIVGSVLRAVAAAGIRVVDAPESVAGAGHHVRTPTEVVDGRAGTALDLTLLLAAALERLSVPALVWVTRHGAVLGYWRRDAALGPVAQVDVADVVNLVDLGVIALVDPVPLGKASGRAPSSSTLLARARAITSADVSDALGVVDVRRARQAGVRPLPVVLAGADGSTTVLESPADGTDGAGAMVADLMIADLADLERHGVEVHDVEVEPAGLEPEVTGAPSAADEVPARVRAWKTSLLDLSLRNRLISYTARSGIVLAPSPGSLGEIEDALHLHEALTLLPADELDEVTVARGVRVGRDLPAEDRTELFARRRAVYTDLPAATYPGRMRALAYKARTLLEETGANNLYLALGTLVWSHDGRDLRSPLILVPVRLLTYGRSGEYRIEIDEAGATTPNLSLLEKLRQVHGLLIPGLAVPVEDGAGIDVATALLSVRTALAGRGLPFHVEESADLAVLQFAKFRLWKDLQDSWQELATNPLVHHLVHTPTQAFVDPVPLPSGVDLDSLGAACPVPADASQLDAVAQAVAGRTFVLEGPPGTGKSQTITNLLSRAVAEGRRVLFVAEKRAALDVVQSRLEEIGMGALTLDLHDAGSRPASVRAQLRAAMDVTVSVDEQGFDADLEQLEGARSTLARYATRLHEPNGAGFSFYSARTGLLALGDVGPGSPVLPVPLDLLTGAGGARLLEVRRLLATVPDVADPARPGPDNPWGFVGLIAPERLDVAGVRRAVDDVDDALRDFAGLVGAGRPGTLAGPLAAARSHEDLSVLAAFTAAAAGEAAADEDAWPDSAQPDSTAEPSGSLPIDLSTLDLARTERWRDAAASAVAEVEAFATAAHPGLDVLTEEALDMPAADLHSRARAAASSGWVGRKARLEDVLVELVPALRPGAELKPRAVVEVTANLMRLQSDAAALATRVRTVPGLRVPEGWNPLTSAGRDAVRQQVEWMMRAGALVDPDGPDPRRDAFVLALRRYLDSPGAGVLAPQVAASVERAARTTATLAQVVRADPGQVSRWSGDAGFVTRWSTTAEGRADAEEAVLGLRRWVTFAAALEPLRKVGMGDARELLLAGAVHAEDAVRALDRGVAMASGRERRAATGLDAFDPLVHDRAVQRFIASADAVREHLWSVIPAQVVAGRGHRAESIVPPGAGPVLTEVQQEQHDAQEVGALQRELARQRGGKGVRALMATYGDLITRLTPCVLVSPDSLARFFPVRAGMFDLVVFDEASQIRVADAVGAMGRAAAVVVVGDSKQLPPSSFGGPTDTEPTDTEPGRANVEQGDLVVPVLDEESILSECVQSRVPRLWLSWHYRSRDESLIAFSNQHYYDGRLSTFPAPGRGRAAATGGGGSHEPRGVRLVRVDGMFHRTSATGPLRTNPIEAQAVVDDIARRFAGSLTHTPSLGVVTLNAPQRALVEQLLRETGDERVLAALDGSAGSGEGLFVKNLENVQGDERDTILFSTAFSADASGRLPLNFGPLNREGGERRLNVAITRARREVVVYSSFAPEDLRANETSSLGIAHLRGYLDLAAAGSAPRAVAGGTSGGTPDDAVRRLTTSVDRHREQVADGLRTRGLVVRTDVGLSDFRLDLVVSLADDPERSVLAVLLDGPGWAARRTVADRDGLPVEVLRRSLRWPAVERVWLPAWLSAPGTVLDRLEEVARLSRASDRDDRHVRTGDSGGISRIRPVRPAEKP